MDDLAARLLAKSAKEFVKKIERARNVRQQSTALISDVKGFHDSINCYDAEGEFTSDLAVENMDPEQMWQQAELRTNGIKQFIQQALVGQQLHSIACEHEDDGEEEEEAEAEEEVEGESDSEGSDAELSEIKKRLLQTDSSPFDSADDDFFEGAEEEWEASDKNDFDFDLPANANPDKKNNKKAKKIKTEVDSPFFNVKEMEEYLDREDKKEQEKINRAGENADGDSEDNEDDEQTPDMFSTWSDEETGKDCMYADFFDPPEDEEQGPQMAQSDGEESEENESDEDMESDEDRPSKKKVHFSEDVQAASEEDDNELSQSTFEKRSEKLRRQIEALEDESVAEKRWQMMGEVKGGDRPENSILEEHVEFKQAPSAAPAMTEEKNRWLEDIIQERIKNKAFDDNKRQVRPVEEAFELTTQKILDQEKSKLSLEEIYEKEYLKLQAPEEEEKTNPAHENIKKMMDDLFPRLDALSSLHYTPLMVVPELKVRSNMPSIRMEEPTPLTMSQAAMMAPEEIQAKKREELKGKGERSKADRLRERKKKKAAKRQKMREREQREKEVERRNPGLGNKYSKERALRELEKDTAGTIEVIKEKKGKKTTSSKAFFGQLQEELTAAKAKKKPKNVSSQTLLL